MTVIRAREWGSGHGSVNREAHGALWAQKPSVSTHGEQVSSREEVGGKERGLERNPAMRASDCAPRASARRAVGGGLCRRIRMHAHSHALSGLIGLAVRRSFSPIFQATSASFCMVLQRDWVGRPSLVASRPACCSNADTGKGETRTVVEL